MLTNVETLNVESERRMGLRRKLLNQGRIIIS
jgi:hypothetical protein